MAGGENTYMAYIVASYLVAIFLVGGLTAWTIWQGGLARRELRQVEAEMAKFAGKNGHAV